MAATLGLEGTRRPVGQLLRGWREQRRLSQLDLALQAEISTRHLSFVENGRAAPSREMLLHLAEQLDLPLRERNHLLLAAGYAPIYSESPLGSPRLATVRAAVRQILAGHEPYPAVVVDRHWQLIEMNASVGLFLTDVAPALLAPPANVLRISLHPEGMAPQIANLAEWRAHLLGRLRRQIAVTADLGLGRLYDELRAYPGDDPASDAAPHDPEAIAIPLRLRYAGGELAFLGTVATFGTPLDVTVSELAIESFFPADAATAAALSESAVGGRRSAEG